MKIQVETESLIVFESALFKTTTSLIVSHDYVLLVDPNWLPNEIEFIKNYINRSYNSKAKYLLFTHSDYDHIIGFGAFKNYKTIASRNFVDNDAKESILEQIRMFDDKYYIQRSYDIEYPRIDLIIEEDNTELTIKSDQYVFLQAVGHNSDGLLTFNVSNGILLAGDYMSGVEFPYIYKSTMEYKNTLDKIESIIKSYDVNYLISGHGDITSDKKEMRRRLEASRSYIQDLENAVEQKIEFNFDRLMESYHFPIIMKEFHEANIELVKKEKGDE